jgi:hypothetical protein
MSVYANRWGGPRYRTEEFAKFLNKHLYNIQEDQLRNGELVNTCLAYDAFISSRHTPLYPASILNIGEWPAWRIKDELGFEGVFARGTEVLIHRDEAIKYEKIENLNVGDRRVINFELVSEFNNDKLQHHLAFTENFLSIDCEPGETQMLLCDGLTSMTILKETDSGIQRTDQFDSKNEQELYLVDITEVDEIESQMFFYLEFNPFSYSLRKNKSMSDKSKNRYYKHRSNTISKRWLEKMRSKVFAMKKDNEKVELTLRRIEDN